MRWADLGPSTDFVDTSPSWFSRKKSSAQADRPPVRRSCLLVSVEVSSSRPNLVNAVPRMRPTAMTADVPAQVATSIAVNMTECAATTNQHDI